MAQNSYCKKVDLKVECRPINVHFECPHCSEEFRIDYGSFCGDFGEPCDWKWSELDCPECENKIEIYSIDWD